MLSPRLDLLIYAHDGRGLGHASRSIAVGMACRRLFKDLKVLFVSGTTMAAQLIGPAPLDWLKLPAYATKVVQGKSIGHIGLSNYNDQDLGKLRTKALIQIIDLYRPRCVLVDHMPQGKHKELLPALTIAEKFKTKWILGVRGIVGDVDGVWSDLARTTFIQNYCRLFWYGDSTILGSQTLKQLQNHFSITPIETGYVSRMAEFQYWQSEFDSSCDQLAGVISIPWIGEKTNIILPHLLDALIQLGDKYGWWQIFLPKNSAFSQNKVAKELQALKYCRLNEPGQNYMNALLNCKVGVIYGGYNSLMDVLFSRTPSLVLLRAMQDLEQQRHVKALIESQTIHLILREENQVNAGYLAEDFKSLLATSHHPQKIANLSGAKTTANYLYNMIKN
jgi:predicted glycosyltransferase